MNYFVVADPIKCIGCRTCMIACVVEHNGEDIFYQNPEEINFNPKLEVVKNAQVSAPIQCRQCEDAPCAKACPQDAISRKNNSRPKEMYRLQKLYACLSTWCNKFK